MKLQSGRLSIRPLQDTDAAILCKWLNDPQVLEFYEGRDRPHSIEMIREAFLSKAEGNHVVGCLVLWGDQPIGYIQTYPIDDEEIVLYGYPEDMRVFGMDQFIGEPLLWNQGIGTLLVRAASNWLIDHSHAERIVMDPRVYNVRAIHVYEKCGFIKLKLLPERELHEGTYCDCWLMELTPPKR